MPLPTFTPPVAPSPGTTDKPEFKVLVADFGDGYTQGSADGLNNVQRVLSLNWETLTPAQCNTIMNFLKGTKGTGIFYYTPSNEATALKWTCSEVSDKRGEGGLRSVTATFRQSFNLAT